MNNTQFSHDDLQVREFMTKVMLKASFEVDEDGDGILTAPTGEVYFASLDELEQHLLELQGLYNVIVKEGTSASFEAVYMLISSCDCYFDNGLRKFVNAINDASGHTTHFQGISLGNPLLAFYGFTNVKGAVKYCNGLRKELTDLGLLFGC